jgi:hypothetical protein
MLLAVFLLAGCATYPANQDPNIDYEGRWSEAGDGNAYYNPYDYVDSLENMYQSSGGTYGSAYDPETTNEP